MQACFKHTEKAAEKSCPFCSKDYCQDCLLLAGKRKTVICEDCYNHFYSKIKGSIIRRYVYLVLGFILIIPVVINIFSSFASGDQNGMLFLVLGAGILLSIAMNAIRLVQFRSWEIKENYSANFVK